MKKIGAILMVLFLVGFAYLLMIMLQPSTNAMIETTNSTVNWTAHSSFGFAQAAMVGWPFWSYLIPGSIGTIAIVGILKGEK